MDAKKLDDPFIFVAAMFWKLFYQTDLTSIQGRLFSR